MKTAVYSWRLSAERKAELEAPEVRCLVVLPPIGSPNAATGHSDDDAEPPAIRRRAMAAIGSVAGAILRARNGQRTGSRNHLLKACQAQCVRSPLRPSDSLMPVPFLRSSVAATNAHFLRQGLPQRSTAASYDRSCARRSFLPR